MSLLPPLLLGLLGVAGLTYLCANYHRADFESDLTSRTRQALGVAGLGNIAPSAEGQIITLTGEVPDEAAKKRAADQAANIFGVEEVRNQITVRVAAPVSIAPIMTRDERIAAANCQAQFNTLLRRNAVRFATGKAIIDKSSFGLLDRIAATAAKCPAARIEIGGHTDSAGRREMNLKLSQDRANAVLEYLKTKGVAADRLAAVGYGPDKPVDKNTTAAGKSRNRRTELIVKGL